MSKISKITVKHYLNDKLKPDGFSKIKKFPIYVRVSFLRKNFRFKSAFLQWYYTEKELLENEKIINYETEIIKFAIQKNEDIEGITDYLFLLKFNVLNIVKQYILSENGFNNSKFYEQLANEIKELINDKTNINKDALNYLIKIDREINNEFFSSFDENMIKNETLKNAILFIKLLVNFDKAEYPENGLNCYEWKYKDGKLKFIKFINNNSLNEHIELIDNYIDKDERDYLS